MTIRLACGALACAQTRRAPSLVVNRVLLVSAAACGLLFAPPQPVGGTRTVTSAAARNRERARRNAERTASTTAQPTITRDELPTGPGLSDQYTPQFGMAWECSGLSQDELVRHLASHRLIQTQRVYDALHSVDRDLFMSTRVPASIAYQDAPQSIGYGATISAPHMHAMCLELLADKLQPGHRALDIGSGSGYLVAAMARMITGKTNGHSAADAATTSHHASTSSSTSTRAATAAPAAQPTSTSAVSPTVSVVGIDHIDELVTMSRANLARWDSHYTDDIVVVTGDGRQGVPGQQFDAIHVGAAAPTIPPALIEQLKPGGRLVIPVGRGTQHLICVDKDARGALTQKTVTGVMYVPLTDERKQRGGV